MHSSFNAREGLVTFPTMLAVGDAHLEEVCEMFQCPRGLGDFSHNVTSDAIGSS